MGFPRRFLNRLDHQSTTADTVVVMQQGQVLHHGASGDAATHRALIDVFDARIAIHALAGQWVVVPVCAQPSLAIQEKQV